MWTCLHGSVLVRVAGPDPKGLKAATAVASSFHVTDGCGETTVSASGTVVAHDSEPGNYVIIASAACVVKFLQDASSAVTPGGPRLIEGAVLFDVLQCALSRPRHCHLRNRRRAVVKVTNIYSFLQVLEWR